MECSYKSIYKNQKDYANLIFVKQSLPWKAVLFSDLGVLILLALAWLLFFTLVNGQYGFHRDELAFLDNGCHLAWGFVEYPPLTPFIAHIALNLFGPSLVGLRFFAALAVGVVIVLAGLMARELGGQRWAQVLSASAVAIAPIVLSHASLFSYETFDYLWWVLGAYCVIRLLNSADPRWWLGVGAALGLGMLTKYTMAFGAAGIAAGVFFTPARRYLKSPWLWAGAALALLIFLLNLVWQMQNHFVSLEFLQSIHARDIRIGRTGISQYLLGQLYICTNPAVLFLWINGLRYYWTSPQGQRFRPVGWMFAVPFVLFLVAQGRYYYLAPVYPMLIAAGCCQAERRLATLPGRQFARQRLTLHGGLVFGGLCAMALALPLAPVNSAWWNVASSVDVELREEIGWPELVKTVADIRANLPLEERAQVGILAGNYGEAGAINLYGPAYGLPAAISGINSFWQRGYGNPPPQTFIVVGLTRDYVEKTFESCELAGHTSNRYGIQNEETRAHPDIFVCRKLRQTWPEFWRSFQHFG
jgi:4-amino-4-deoxy-L-arabinose transferase-like glycosyltransferase